MENLEQLYDIKEFYNQDTKIITMPKVDIPLHPKGLGYDIFESLKLHFGKIAQRDAFTDEADTYDDLFIRSVRTAIKLQKLGVNPGDRVTLCSHNHINCASAYLGSIFAGAITANVDPTLSQIDIEELVSQVRSRVLFVSEDSENLVELVVQNLKLDAIIVVFGESQRNLRYADFVCEQGGEDIFEPFVPKRLEDTAMILFSSGSTGLPKGICLSHKFFCYHSTSGNILSYMLFPTLYWISANTSLLFVLKNGGTRSITSVYDPDLVWRHILKYNVQLLQVTPYEALELIKYVPEVKDGMPLIGIGMGGYATTKENMEKVRKALPGVLAGDFFAMTETGLLFAGIDPVSYNKVRSVGVPVKNYQYKIVDPETEQTLGFDQPGELRVKSEFLFSGYYNKDSSDTFDDDGFFKTGDIAYFDKDFSFFIVDRIKEMFKYKGFHIVPVKLESILVGHPEVFRAVVIGIPHPIDEHHVCAIVVPKEGSNVSPEEIEEYFNNHVDDERKKIRAGVKFFDAIPLTPTGKVNRKEVKKRVTHGMK